MCVKVVLKLGNCYSFYSRSPICFPFLIERHNCTLIRERVRVFSDCLSVINKCFPTIPSRKRSRLDALSNERSNTLSSVDRSASGMGNGKMGAQNHASTSSFEMEQQKPEGRAKNTIPNKRTRTSMVDPRVCLFCLYFPSFLFSISFLYLVLTLQQDSA